MKTIILAFLSVVVISGCGKGSGGVQASNGDKPACSDTVGLGVWSNNLPSFLTFLDSCQGTESYCGSEFTFSKPENNLMQIEITKNNGNAGCLSVGSHQCQFIASDTDLSFDCGNGVEFYTK